MFVDRTLAPFVAAGSEDSRSFDCAEKSSDHLAFSPSGMGSPAVAAKP
jgi:hypothetical protein